MTITQVKNLIVGVLQRWFPNKKVLDKLNEVNGKLYYNGVEVSLNSLTEEDVQQAIQTAIAELTNKIAIENNVTNAVTSDLFINDWNPIGEYTISGNNITIAYDFTSNTFLEDAMNDMARFFGTLYQNNITSIKYNGTNYIWNEELGLKGSNWINENYSDNSEYTLVKTITNDFKNGVIQDNYIMLLFDNIEYTYQLVQK